MENVSQALPVKELPLYQSHKKVRAAEIIAITDHVPGGGRILQLDNGTAVNVDMAWVTRNPTLAVGGYFVEYQEVDKYTSYSPAGPFENGNTKIIPYHQQRVLAEKAELDEKLSKLEAFLGTETYINLDPDEQIRLDKQADIMSEYSCLLDDRIAAF